MHDRRWFLKSAPADLHPYNARTTVFTELSSACSPVLLGYRSLNICVLDVGCHDLEVVKCCICEGDPDALARYHSGIELYNKYTKKWTQYRRGDWRIRTFSFCFLLLPKEAQWHYWRIVFCCIVFCWWKMWWWVVVAFSISFFSSLFSLRFSRMKHPSQEKTTRTPIYYLSIHLYPSTVRIINKQWTN